MLDKRVSVEFKVALLRAGVTIKQFAIDQGWDIDRLRNVLRGFVNPSDEEIDVLKKFIKGVGK